jgi:hypothetical protein
MPVYGPTAIVAAWLVCTLVSLSERPDDTNGHRGIRGHEGEQAQRGRAQVTIKNPGLQNMSLLNMHERSLPPTGARRRMDSELTLA